MDNGYPSGQSFSNLLRTHTMVLTSRLAAKKIFVIEGYFRTNENLTMYNVSAFPKTKHTAVLYYFSVPCIFVAKSNTISYVVITIVFVLFVLHKLRFF